MTDPVLYTPQLSRSLARLLAWLNHSDWKSYDPFDYKGDPRLESFLKNKWLSRIVEASGLVFPIATRRLLGVKRRGTASGYAALVSGYSTLGQITGEPYFREKARKAFDLLMAELLPGDGWGLPFDWQTSPTMRIPANVPLLYTTFTGLEGMLDYYHLTRDRAVLDRAVEIARAIPKNLNMVEIGRGLAFSYSRYDDYEVLNTNSLCGATLCRIGAEAGAEDVLATGRRMVLFALEEQQEDGSWVYFARRSGKPQVPDNYHNSMTFRGLVEGSPYIADEPGLRRAIENGIRYYESTFLVDIPFRSDEPYPKDIYAIYKGIMLYRALLRNDWITPQHAAEKISYLVDWSARHLQNPDGSYLFRMYKFFGRVNIKAIRWGPGIMLMALANALQIAAPVEPDQCEAVKQFARRHAA